MTKQLHMEDVETGSEITPLEKVASSHMLVRWAGATGDFNPLHYEDSFAEAQGVGKPIVHGQLKRAWLVQMMIRWIGEEGILRKLSCQFRAMDYPRLMKEMTVPQDGETWTCRGIVTKTYEANGENLVDCDIWVENGKGEKTTIGNATAVLPSRSQV